jgi:hypothetical protein
MQKGDAKMKEIQLKTICNRKFEIGNSLSINPVIRSKQNPVNPVKKICDNLCKSVSKNPWWLTAACRGTQVAHSGARRAHIGTFWGRAAGALWWVKNRQNLRVFGTTLASFGTKMGSFGTNLGALGRTLASHFYPQNRIFNPKIQKKPFFLYLNNL